MMLLSAFEICSPEITVEAPRETSHLLIARSHGEDRSPSGEEEVHHEYEDKAGQTGHADRDQGGGSGRGQPLPEISR